MFNKGRIEELETRSQELEAENKALVEENNRLARYGALDATALEKAIEDLGRNKANLEESLDQSASALREANLALVATADLVILQEVGIYQFADILDTAVAYQEKIKDLEAKIKQANRTGGGAVKASTNFTLNGSVRDGQKMLNEVSKLMLRAYNGEVEDAVRTLKPYKIDAATDRLNKVRETIQKLGQSMAIEISSTYHALRIKELRLMADFLQKQSEEKEAQRAEKERLREEAQAQKEFEAEKVRLLKELGHHESVLQKAQESGNHEVIAAAQEKIAEVQNAVAGVEERAANIRAGYVYVISNIGSFGGEVVKIGLTRRLDYEDRIRELSDASVPFIFDVHAVIFSNDAVSLEKKLHHELEDSRINKVNQRKEFFRTSPGAVKVILETLAGEHLLVYNETPEAADWRISSQVRV